MQRKREMNKIDVRERERLLGSNEKDRVEAWQEGGR